MSNNFAIVIMLQLLNICNYEKKCCNYEIVAIMKNYVAIMSNTIFLFAITTITVIIKMQLQ